MCIICFGNMQKKLFTLLILSAFSTNYINSEVMEEVVVQASLLGQTEDGISDPLHVLDGAEIADMATTSLGETLSELLRDMPTYPQSPTLETPNLVAS